MPVIRHDARWTASTTRESLVTQLANELVGPGTPSGPPVFEVPIRLNKTWHVIVVWDRWRGLPEDERSSIILDAYEQAGPEESARQPKAADITIAIGATAEEAIAADLRPFTVRTGIDLRGPASEPVREAMLREGALDLPTGVELRFPSLQMARDARERLGKQAFHGLEEVHWGISESFGRGRD